MNKKQADRICAAFHDADISFGGTKSTEFLISFTADTLGISYEKVVEALAMIHDAGAKP